MSSKRKTVGALESFQRAICDAVRVPLQPDEGMQESNAQTAERLVKPNSRLSAFDRLEIYNQQYWWRIQGAFFDDFTALAAVLGSEAFERLSIAYLNAHASTSWNLGLIGSKLVDFLRENPRLTHPRTDLAIDVAQLEWARILAFDGPERPVVNAAKLSRTPPDQLQLGLQPTLQLLQLGFPVDDLMDRLKRGESATGSNAASPANRSDTKPVTVRKSHDPIYLAVHRVELSVYFKRLEPEAWRLLVALRDGATLEAACESAFETSEKPPEICVSLIQEWFSKWMQFGWFCRRPRSRS